MFSVSLSFSLLSPPCLSLFTHTRALPLFDSSASLRTEGGEEARKRESGSLNVSHSLWRQSGVEKKERKTLRFSCSTSRRTGSSTRSSAATSGTRLPSVAVEVGAPSVPVGALRTREGAASGTARRSPEGASLVAVLLPRSPAEECSSGEGPAHTWGRSLQGIPVRQEGRRSDSLFFKVF